jgi:hypothetical protein
MEIVFVMSLALIVTTPTFAFSLVVVESRDPESQARMKISRMRCTRH